MAGLTSAAFNLEKAVERIIWQRYAPAALVVDSGMQVLHFDGNAGPYLDRPGSRDPPRLKLVQEELALDLRTALHRAKKEETPVRWEGFAFHETVDRRYQSDVIPIKAVMPTGRIFSF